MLSAQLQRQPQQPLNPRTPYAFSVLVYIYVEPLSRVSMTGAGRGAVLQVVDALEDLLLHARHVVLEGGVSRASAVNGDFDVIVELLDGFHVGVVPAACYTHARGGGAGRARTASGAP